MRTNFNKSQHSNNSQPLKVSVWHSVGCTMALVLLLLQCIYIRSNSKEGFFSIRGTKLIEYYSWLRFWNNCLHSWWTNLEMLEFMIGLDKHKKLDYPINWNLCWSSHKNGLPCIWHFCFQSQRYIHKKTCHGILISNFVQKPKWYIIIYSNTYNLIANN